MDSERRRLHEHPETTTLHLNIDKYLVESNHPNYSSQVVNVLFVGSLGY